MRPTKEEIARQITDLLGVAPVKFSTGSTEPKALFIAIVDRLGLPIDTALRKEELAGAIAKRAGLAWTPDCYSRGATVTETGLYRLLEAVPILAARHGIVLVRDPVVQDLEEVIESFADTPGSDDGTGRALTTSQGLRVPVEVRLEVERHSMQVVSDHYAGDGWEVEDVHKHEPFDLLCHRSSSVRHVEVKGTQSLGLEVFLTRNEVAHAKTHYPDTALAVVSEIKVSSSIASGGRLHIWEPWEVDDSALEAMAFRYRLPART